MSVSVDVAPFPQSLNPFTVILPETDDAPKSTVIDGVFPPEAMTAPEGTVQV